ncbi:hypothetical protein BH11BAC1_BH11BAC1_27790 [soil metagenome]
MDLKEQIRLAVEEKLQGTEAFFVDIKASYSKIAVFVDHPNGMKLEDCVAINRFLESKPELASIFETHELEVSSPGMDEPLKVLKQYIKRIGQEVNVLMKDGIRQIGTLKSVDENGIVVVESKRFKGAGKNTFQTIDHNISFNDIKETKVVFNFNKVLEN